ncbi:LysR substrate-binding domain-containing protein, partial [Salmonella enterica subsp. enterica]
RRLTTPESLTKEILLRSYRPDEWDKWMTAAGLAPWRATGAVFDSSRLMVEAAMQAEGVALVPVSMFARELESGNLVRPFATEI